jgi:hypothetical protein
MFAEDSDDVRMVCELDERTCRALLSAIEFTLEKWVGQGELDQEQLFALKPTLQGMILEFNLLRKSA